MFLLGVMVSLCAGTVMASDVIQLKNGDEISATVLSVSSTEITYRRADAFDGPVRTLPVGDVLFIRYEDGTKENFAQTVAPSYAEQPTQLFSASEELRFSEEQQHISNMGNNNIRIRFSPGVAVGTSKKTEFMDADWVGGYFAFDAMWLHSIANHSGNFGIGMGIMPILSSIEEGNQSYSYSGVYYTIPMQLQHVARSGFSCAFLVTPALAVSQSVEQKGTGLKMNDSDDMDYFADIRVALGAELGYSYKRFDFGLRYNLWIGNMIAGFDSTVLHEFAFTVGYRIKLN